MQHFLSAAHKNRNKQKRNAHKFAQHGANWQRNAVQHCLTGGHTHSCTLAHTLLTLFGAANWQLDQTRLQIEQHFMNNMNEIQTSQQKDAKWNDVRGGGVAVEAYKINRSTLYSCHFLINFNAYLCESKAISPTTAAHQIHWPCVYLARLPLLLLSYPGQHCA